MKKLTFIFLMILSTSVVFCANIQKPTFTNYSKTPMFFNDSCDIITFKNGDEIAAKVIEINDTQIKYKKCSNLDGPIIVVEKSKVLFIKYKNGQKDVFSSDEIDKNTNNKDKLSYKGFPQIYFKGKQIITRKEFIKELTNNYSSHNNIFLYQVFTGIAYFYLFFELIFVWLYILSIFLFPYILILALLAVFFAILAHLQFNKAIEKYNNNQ